VLGNCSRPPNWGRARPSADHRSGAFAGFLRPSRGPVPRRTSGSRNPPSPPVSRASAPSRIPTSAPQPSPSVVSLGRAATLRHGSWASPSGQPPRRFWPRSSSAMMSAHERLAWVRVEPDDPSSTSSCPVGPQCARDLYSMTHSSR